MSIHMEEPVILAEVARRVGCSAQLVSQLARDDPNFPERVRVGWSWVVEWSEAEAYFRNRRPRPVGRPKRQRNK